MKKFIFTSKDLTPTSWYYDHFIMIKIPSRSWINLGICFYLSKRNLRRGITISLLLIEINIYIESKETANKRFS